MCEGEHSLYFKSAFTFVMARRMLEANHFSSVFLNKRYSVLQWRPRKQEPELPGVQRVLEHPCGALAVRALFAVAPRVRHFRSAAQRAQSAHDAAQRPRLRRTGQ